MTMATHWEFNCGSLGASKKRHGFGRMVTGLAQFALMGDEVAH